MGWACNPMANGKRARVGKLGLDLSGSDSRPVLGSVSGSVFGVVSGSVFGRFLGRVRFLALIWAPVPFLLLVLLLFRW